MKAGAQVLGAQLWNRTSDVTFQQNVKKITVKLMVVGTGRQRGSTKEIVNK